MTHAEYLERVDSGRSYWGVKELIPALRIVRGDGEVRAFRLTFAVLVIPSLIFGAWTLYRHEPAGLVWTALGLLALRTGRPDMSCGGGCVWVLCGLIGTALAFRFGPNPLFGGMLPLFGFGASSIILGTTLNEMGIELRRSSEAFDRLEASGLLMFQDRTPPDA